MALDTERRAAGIRGILRRLRGAAPRPESPEDRIEGFMASGEEEETPPLSEDEEASKETSLGQKPVPPAPPRRLR